MRIKILISVFLTCNTLVWGQFGPQQIIDPDISNTRASIAADLNGDGTLDLVSLTNVGNLLVWYSNLDGEGNFGEAQLISEDIDGTEQFRIADMDSDGDLDIVFATNLVDKIGWLENLDGLANFGPVNIILEDQFVYSFEVGDLDGDNSPDVFALYNLPIGNEFVWFKNVDLGSSFVPNIIEENWPEYTIVKLKDIDNDGDQDLLTGVNQGLAPGAFLWYENLDGLGTLSEYNFIFQFDYFASYQVVITNISLEDINGDKISDLVFSVVQPETGFKIYWMKGLAELGTFNFPTEIDNPPGEHIIDLQLVDLDNDSDLDLLYGLSVANEIGWYENLEEPGSFAPRRIISTEVDDLKNVLSGFINDDDLIDVFSVSTADTKLAWYENLGVLNVPDNNQNAFSVYPNPTSGDLNIDSPERIESIQVYNTVGQKLNHFTHSRNITLAHLTPGMYFIKITAVSGFTKVERIIIN